MSFWLLLFVVSALAWLSAILVSLVRLGRSFSRQNSTHLKISTALAEEIRDGRLVPLGLLAYNAKTDCLNIRVVDSQRAEEVAAIVSRYNITCLVGE